MLKNMVNAAQNQNDDFFRPLAEEQKQQEKTAGDEIVFRDEKGQLKILRQGQVFDFAPLDPSESSGFQAVEKSNLEIADSNKVKGRDLTGFAEPEGQKTEKPKLEFQQDKSRRSPEGRSRDPDFPPKAETSGPPAADVKNEAKEIIKKSGISFSDENLIKRFDNLISSRLREVRDQVQVRQILIAAPENGGLGLDAASAALVLDLISRSLNDQHEKLRSKASPQTFTDLHMEVKKILAEPLSLKPMTFKSAVVEKTLPIPESKPTPKPPKPKIAAPRPEIKPIIAAPVLPKIKPDLGEKPKIQDIRFQPKLVGPIEELRAMTLTDFRRLSPSPAQAIEKILEKIRLLEEESFVKKIQGIKAWQDSEISRLYIALGRASLEAKKPITQIISERAQASEPVLSAEELEAIFELNQKLRH